MKSRKKGYENEETIRHIFRQIRALKRLLGRIQDLVRGGSVKRPPTSCNCYCHLTSSIFTRKNMVKIFTFVSL